MEIALPQGERLRSGDVLQLDDGSLIEIVAKPELLLEVRASASIGPGAACSGCWAIITSRVEIHERRLRLHRSDTARALLQPQGARLIDIEAPFEPEGGAYEGHAHR